MPPVTGAVLRDDAVSGSSMQLLFAKYRASSFSHC